MSLKQHQRVWVKHHGAIPRDEAGRSYEIHHRNGDHDDNRIENLQCVTIAEHFQIHFDQGDLCAAAAVLTRMGADPDKLKALNSAAGKIAGKNSFLAKSGWHDPDVKRRGGENTSGLRWYTNGTVNTRSAVHPGEGWVLGRPNVGKFGFKLGRKIGTFWNKDGVNKRAHECPGDGWVPGRYLTPDQRAVRSQIARTTRWPKSAK